MLGPPAPSPHPKANSVILCHCTGSSPGPRAQGLTWGPLLEVFLPQAVVAEPFQGDPRPRGSRCLCWVWALAPSECRRELKGGGLPGACSPVAPASEAPRGNGPPPWPFQALPCPGGRPRAGPASCLRTQPGSAPHPLWLPAPPGSGPLSCPVLHKRGHRDTAPVPPWVPGAGWLPTGEGVRGQSPSR